MFSAMFGVNAGAGVLPRTATLGAVAACLALVGAQWAVRDQDKALTRIAALPWWALGAVLGAALFFVITVPAQDRAFIYFQF
jgi:hypothetical protein